MDGVIEPALLLALDKASLDEGGRLTLEGRAVSAYPILRIEVFGPDGLLGLAETGQSGFCFVHVMDPPLPEGSELRVVVHAIGLPPRMEVTRLRFVPQAMRLQLEEAKLDGAGMLRVRGWVVGLAPIAEVLVFLGSDLLGRALTGLSRRDVAQVYPAYPEAAQAGFLLLQHLDDRAAPGQMLRVEARMIGGISRQAEAALKWPGLIQPASPKPLELRMHCDRVTLSGDGALAISGWAVSAAGIDRIAVELAGSHLGHAEIGCDRPDVGNAFPHIASARHAGFRFNGTAVDLPAGEQVVRLSLRDLAGAEVTRLLPVLVAAPEVVSARSGLGGAIRFCLDTPRLTTTPSGQSADGVVSGFLSVAGWAVAASGIADVTVSVDGRVVGEAYYGIRREDVGLAFPELDQALLSGFAILVPPQMLRRGHHGVQVVIRDRAGDTATCDFNVQADPAVAAQGPWQLCRKLTDGERDLRLQMIDGCGPRPAFLLTMRLHDASGGELAQARASLASLRRQAYVHWSLVVSLPPGCPPRRVRAALLQNNEDLTDRVRFRFAETAAPLSGVSLYAGPLSPGDQLGADALLELALAAGQAGNADFLYADERRIDPADGEPKAWFKPGWSPDLLLSTNYIGRPWVASAALLARCGASAGEYDQVLRLTEQARHILHVDRVLCARARRQLDSVPEERLALRAALQRRGIAGRVTPGCLPGIHRVRRQLAGKPLVSIIIPTAGARGLIQICIESIRRHSSHRHIEIIVIDNIPADRQDVKDWIGAHADRVLPIDEAFNWSRFNNRAASLARGDYLLFLNDDIEVPPTCGNWIEGLLEHAQRPEIGVVGPRLLYPDGKVQHAGMFLAITDKGLGVARHAFRFSPADEPGPFGQARTQRNVIAVTGACFMVGRNAFAALGGFDERHAIINNDLDYCLRAQAAGLLVVFTPHVTLIHHEMVSRADLPDTHDDEHFSLAWRDRFLRGDPYFSAHLSMNHDDYVPEVEPTRVLHLGHPLIAAQRVRRILVLKLDHIGDFIASLPALRRLKASFPQAELHVLAAGAARSLAPLEPAIDRLHVFDFFHARSARGRLPVSRADLQALQARLEPLHFDLAIDLRRQGDTRCVLNHTGATWLAGFDQAGQFPFLDIAVDWEGDVAGQSKRHHVTEAFIRCVDAVAAACATDRAVIVGAISPAAARAEVAALPPLRSFLPKLFQRRLVCVHPGAGNENKQWPAASFAALVDLLIEHDDTNVILIGGPDETAIAERVHTLVASPERVFMLAGQTRLDDLPKLLRACALYVGNDSGPKHLAAGLGVPTLGIHSGTVDAGEWGPMGPSALALRRDMSCSPCYKSLVSDCHRHMACLTGIAPGEVHRVCRLLLSINTSDSSQSELSEPACRAPPGSGNVRPLRARRLG